MNVKECLFTLVASKIMKLSNKYQTALATLHEIFFNVNCDFNLLEEILENQNNDKRSKELRETRIWTPLEDMAIMDNQESEEYKFIVNKKGL
jgi:hypothetical protein